MNDMDSIDAYLVIVVGETNGRPHLDVNGTMCT